MTEVEQLQLRSARWVIDCFGPEYLKDKHERAMRLLEEATEAAQALGISRERALTVIEHVYSRPLGDIAQELAGTGVTLLTLAASCGISLKEVLEKEIHRVETTDWEKFRKRNREKAAAGIGNYPTGKA